MNVSDFLLKRLSAWGVHFVYGFPGDGINGIPRFRQRGSQSFGMSLLEMDSEEGGIIRQALHQMFPGSAKKADS